MARRGGLRWPADPVEPRRASLRASGTERRRVCRAPLLQYHCSAIWRGLYAFIDSPPGPGWTTNEGYRARWLLEAIEGGDTVVPIAYYLRSNIFQHWSQPPLRYAVFAAGLPREAIEAQLTRTLRFFVGMNPDDIPAIIQTYRLLAGPP
jgi:hypothetical protein